MVFKVSFNGDPILTELIKYAEKEGIKVNEKEIETSKQMISRFLKAYIARDLWDASEFYQILNEEDPIIKQALEAIKTGDIKKGAIQK